MKNKWEKYYSKIFNNYKSEMFEKLWGSKFDECQSKYIDNYKFELMNKADEFAYFMYLYNKYKMPYSRDAIAMKIIELFEGLGTCTNPNGAYEIADNILSEIDKKSIA